MDKLKITKKELDEIYELVPDIEDTKNIPEKEIEPQNFTFDQHVEYYDKEGKKVEDDAS